MKCQVSVIRLAGFGQLGIINDSHIKSWNKLNNHRRLENTNYTKMKYGETFYGRNTTPTLNVMKITRYSKRITPENNELTHKTDNKCQGFLGRPASFCQLGLINDPNVFLFSKNPEMGPTNTKDSKYKLHYSEVNGDVLRPPHDTNTGGSDDKEILQEITMRESIIT